jgi:hypothetical protein
MKETKTSRHIGRKIWYSANIALSVLVLVISAAGVIGTWVVGQSLVNFTQSLLVATARTAGGLRVATVQINQESGNLRQISQSVAAISLRIGENIEDKGLLATLLPAEQERKLNETTAKIQETLSTVREFLISAVGIYRSIDRLPFVNLPGLSEEKVLEIVQSVSDVQAAVAELMQNIQDFRSGVAKGVGRITEAANRLTDRLDNLSKNLTEVEKALAALQDLAIRLEKVVPQVFGLIALFLTFFLGYVAYTQVEFIRLEVRRWKALKAPAEPPAAAASAAQPAEPPATAASAAEPPAAAASAAEPPVVAASAAQPAEPPVVAASAAQPAEPPAAAASAAQPAEPPAVAASAAEPPVVAASAAEPPAVAASAAEPTEPPQPGEESPQNPGSSGL